MQHQYHNNRTTLFYAIVVIFSAVLWLTYATSLDAKRSALDICQDTFGAPYLCESTY